MKRSRNLLIPLVVAGLLGMSHGAFANCADTALVKKADDFSLKNGWEMQNVKSSRRQIIENSDVLKFRKKSTNSLKLTVLDASGKFVLGKRITLTLDTSTGVATANDQYGRDITFAIRKRDDGSEWLCYEADFLEQTQDQPDESGDGKPK